MHFAAASGKAKEKEALAWPAAPFIAAKASAAPRGAFHHAAAQLEEDADKATTKQIYT